ncbi:MAG: hypothetical protein RBU21_13940 [FCB group bacterium]|jgi:hypothetical protein|nr:hypothetical protein [FCB group bacterium]
MVPPGINCARRWCRLSLLLAVGGLFWQFMEPAAMAEKKVETNSTETIALTTSSPTLDLNIEADTISARLKKLGWDTEGTGRAGINLLKSPIELRLSKNGQAVTPNVHIGARDNGTIEYRYSLGEGNELAWRVAVQPDTLRMRVSCDKAISEQVDKLELLFPFEPVTTVTSIISDTWTADGKFHLPCIINAPDLGQMLLTCASRPELTGRIEGSRSEKWLTVTLELPVPGPTSPIDLEFTPVLLPMPEGFKDEKQWKAARRGWFNLIQQSCGASGGSRDVIGVWANNVLSDPVSSVLYMLGDATLLVPELAPGVSMPPILRRAVDYWIDCKTNSDGLVAYTALGTAGSDAPVAKDINPADNQNVMDGNPAVLIGAWCYVEASNDTEWLTRRIERLEFLSRYMERRDVDGDGLIESKQSGNSGSRPPRDPDCAWDCYVTGHKNAYVNTMAYRAWLGLADLEGRLGRTEKQQQYRELAARLKASFHPAFYNPETGWLGLWRSRDGVLHDIHTDVATSFAINYGVIEPGPGKAMLQRYWSELEKTAFKRFDLGVPLNLRPVPREEMEVYFEFEQFLNGGCGVSNTSYLLNALYIVGMDRQADTILDAMLKRQSEGVFPNGGGFQNGFVDRMGKGAEVFDWSGNPSGYEGHLVYCWSFLHSMLLREPALRDRVYAK